MNILQDYSKYIQTDHDLWATLFERQNKMIFDKASIEFKRGFELLSLDPNAVARLDELNEKIGKISGWALVGASGLVSDRDFFSLLKGKKFPINLSMRKPHELEFAELPDIFHDIYGHACMLANPMFCQFMEKYSTLALEYIDNDIAVTYFGRLYWFTLEMGLIKEDGQIKPYGGAIMTSSNEIDNVYGINTQRNMFDLRNVINTDYNNLKLQKEYFVLESYQQLFDSLDEIGLMLDKTYSVDYKLIK